VSVVIAGVVFFLFFILLLATSRKNYRSDLRWQFYHRCNFRQEKTDQILQVINLWIRIWDLKIFFNIARYGLFSQFGSYLWNNWS